MKKILYLYEKRKGQPIPFKQHMHVGWTNDCCDMYRVKYWGYGFTPITIKSLQAFVDRFKPDYIYATMRTRYADWLPDISSIKVPKIFVECDEYKWYRTDPWYNQFDKVLCRQPRWGNIFCSREKTIGPIVLEKTESWKKVPLFRWSVPECSFSQRKRKRKRNGIYFIGAVSKKGYTDRQMMYSRLNQKIKFCKKTGNDFWELIQSASAIVCPSESNFGNFIPGKIFESSAGGAAILTNCDLIDYNMKDLDKCVIRYTDLDDLETKLSMDFTEYHNIASEVMKHHTHRIRYKEIFK